MWQRIQTVFFILTALISILFLFVPSMVFDNGIVMYAKDDLVMASASGAVAIISVAAVFFGKKRQHQIQLAYFACLVIIGGQILYMFYSRMNDLGIDLSYGSLCPPAAILFLLLAIRSVRKDEKLIRSMDRFR